MFLNRSYLRKIVRRALDEDIGPADITTQAVIPADERARGVVKAEETLVAAGLEVAREVFLALDPRMSFHPEVTDGEKVRKGTTLVRLQGSAQALLSGERVALNFLQRLSGIATLSRRFASFVKEGGTRIVDTRKTTPGLRGLEKYAVRVGGCHNHRFGLYDGVLIKENHIAIAGGITEAIRRVQREVPHTVKIEVETETLEEVREAVGAGADIIMLDNMDIKTMGQSIAWIRNASKGTILVEISGGVSLDTIGKLAGLGADRISAGAMIHAARWMDISMDIHQEEGAGNQGGAVTQRRSRP
jgi:nicotinate-nucleotide pyrophosphorylase (carboxylating)